MAFLFPATTHIVSWTKQNLLDGAEYFPQAVIRDTRQDLVLATLNLENTGNNIRYTNSWPVVTDPSEHGREIEVEITVYEDAARTQPSGIYGRWTERYVIFDFKAPSGGGIGGGNASVDYRRIEKMIERAVADIPKPEKIDLSSIVAEIDGVKQSFGDTLRKWLRLGRKATEIEQVERNLKNTASELTEAIKGARTSIGEIDTATKKAVAAIEEAAKSGAGQIATAADRHENKLSKRTDDELTYVVEKFKEVMSATAEEFSNTVTENIKGEMSRPMRVQSVQDHQVVREPTAPTGQNKKSGDDRVNRMMTYAS